MVCNYNVVSSSSGTHPCIASNQEMPGHTVGSQCLMARINSITKKLSDKKLILEGLLLCIEIIRLKGVCKGGFP